MNDNFYFKFLILNFEFYFHYYSLFTLTHIGLISDTHNYLDETVFEHFVSCNEIWHAGDFGNIALADKLSSLSKLPVRGVYGNIDSNDIRLRFPEELYFTCEEVNVFIRHIGGYPGRYAPGVKKKIIDHSSDLFICGHSHILKIMYDEKINCLHINPGAAGNQGWHTVRTVIRFTIDKKNIRDCQIIELGSK